MAEEKRTVQDAQQPKEKPEFALTETGEFVINEPAGEVIAAPGEPAEGEAPAQTEEQKEEVAKPSAGQEEESGEAQKKEPDGPVDAEKQETQGQESKEGQKDVVQPEGEYYTKEEIQKIGIDKLDPKKIPEELVPFYKSMQADYTRKTQKLAEERRKLEEAKKEIEKQAKIIEIQAQTNLPADVIRSLLEESKAEIRGMVGEDLDEFDPDVQALVQTRMAEKVFAYKQKQVAQQKLQAAEEYLKQTDPLFAETEQVFKYILQNELPLKAIEELKVAQEIGDPGPFLQVYNLARERVLFAKEQQQVGSEQQKIEASSKAIIQSTQKEPPSAESAGGEDPNKVQTKKITPKDLAGRSAEEQANLLIQMGLV